MKEIIKVGIAGYGRSGRDIHTNWLKKDPRFKIVAVADALEDRRDDAEKELGCRVYANYRELLAAGGFDLFVNATPNMYHVDAVLAGLTAGFHTLGEKPTATTEEQFEQILCAADENKKLFFPFQNSRFFPGYLKMKEIIDSGVLGEIICVRLNWSGFGRRWDWQTRQDKLAGNLLNTGPHPVDIGISLFGDTTPNVFCRMASHHWGLGDDADNFCALTLHGKDAPVIEIQISSFLSYAQGDMMNVQGTLGGLSGNMTELHWKYFDPGIAPRQSAWQPWSLNRGYCSETLPWEEYHWTAPAPMRCPNWFAEIVPCFYDDLFNVLVKKMPRTISLDQVRRQVMVIQEARKQNPLPTVELEESE